MTLLIEDYSTLIFDCDGVLLNSNSIKSEAFYKTALPYGEDVARKLADHHVSNGGVSRYEKFDFFLKNIVPQGKNGPDLEELLNHFSDEVMKGLLSCEISLGLQELRKKTSQAKWIVVSGGNQTELHHVFRNRKLEHFFDGGIFGSPDSKESIMTRELENGNICLPAIMLGDSKYDYEISLDSGVDFLFVSDWTEFSGWMDFFDGSTHVIGNLMNLVEMV